jgi:hypothetical protein
MSDSAPFAILTLPFENNIFPELKNSVEFEQLGKGRVGNHLVLPSDQGIPLVRTTTQYKLPAQAFTPLHCRIIETMQASMEISALNQTPPLFNHALIELYDRSYHKMNFHSDQCLDLDPNSYIGLFSCYENPPLLNERYTRKLKIKNKTTSEEFEIPLAHNSLVLFSVSTNYQYQHKIVLEPVPNQKPYEQDNRWLGVTFRKSKTFIQFKDKLPYFSNGNLLELADEEQKTEFFQLRGKENSHADFQYPSIYYTLSPADLMPPKGSCI